jgi:hypothetical protein
MTYRSDHDAALHRLDTLERELAEMKAAKPAEVVAISAPPPRSRAWLALGMVGGMAAVGVGAWKLVGGLRDGPASAAADTSPPPTSDREKLRECAAIAMTPCRPLLHLHDSLDLSYDERGMVAMWSRVEDELAVSTDPTRREELLTARVAILHDLGL